VILIFFCFDAIKKKRPGKIKLTVASEKAAITPNI
jgi:hypothetical protein